MLIPVRCFTCGQVLADKYLFYTAEVRARKLKVGQDPGAVVYLTKTSAPRTPEADVLDELGLTKQCCRRHMLAHVDIE